MERYYYLSLGSNMGDSRQYLDSATMAIGTFGIILGQSSDYATEPQGFVEQAEFINRSLLVKSTLSPIEFLRNLQRIELDLHRERIVHWGPRTIDIDIIWCKGVSMYTEELILPHPRFTTRAFVMKPMLELPMVDPLLAKQMQHFLPFVESQEVRKIL